MPLAFNKFDLQACNLMPMKAEVGKMVEEEGEGYSSSSTTTTATTAASSSIGRNSDDDEEENEEVQSVYNGGPLDMMESLEEVLPIRRGISKFYNGKSRSFTSLVKASSSNSIKEVAKPENAYTRRRRNLLAFNHTWEKNHRTSPYRTTSATVGGGGITKRSCRSTLALAVSTISSSESISNTSDDSTSSPHSTSPPANLPPLHPNSSAAWRSFSVFDLRQCGNVDGYNSLNHQEG